MSSAEITAIFPSLHVLNAFSTAYHSREQGINKAIIYMQTFFEEVNMRCFFFHFLTLIHHFLASTPTLL